MRTPRRIRLDGERVWHYGTTVCLPEYGDAWVLDCGRVLPKDARVKDAGDSHTMCQACRRHQLAAVRFADAVGVVEQPETPADLRREP